MPKGIVTNPNYLQNMTDNYIMGNEKKEQPSVKDEIENAQTAPHVKFEQPEAKCHCHLSKPEYSQYG